jgi:hypothetical protein
MFAALFLFIVIVHDSAYYQYLSSSRQTRTVAQIL